MDSPRTSGGAGEVTRIAVSQESELISAARNGDRSSMDQLLRSHRDRIWAICRRITGNDADAADATQEALISIVRHLSRFDGASSFSTWTYRVATNAALDELRRRVRRPTPVDELPFDARHSTHTDRVPDQLADRLAVDAALAVLPPDFRAAVVLRDLCDLDYAEIGEILGIPPGTVRSRIARGRAALVPLLNGNRNPSPNRHKETP